MPTDCPPQLQLSIQPNTTSFKRSFEQFGFDLESPGGADTAGTAHAATSDGRNERNKRARSTVSFDSETASDSSDNTMPSTSSNSSNTSSQGSDIIVAFPPAALTEAPRLPTPVAQDVEMADYSTGESRPHLRDEYRLSLHRFNQFDSEMALLRQSPPATPPPTLPPLRHRLSSDDQAFFRRRTPSNSFPSDIFSDNSSSRASYDISHADPTDVIAPASEVPNSPFDLVFREIPPLSLPTINLSESPPSSPILNAGFRDRLNTALEALRSPSPLVPGLEDAAPELREMEEVTEEPHPGTVVENNRSRTYELPPILPPIQTGDHDLDVAHSPSSAVPETPSSQVSLPDPPVLPPIPTIDARIDTVDEAWQSRAPGSPDRVDNGISLARRLPPSESSALRLPSSAHQNSTHTNSLVDHPLPSPVLRDLHSWIEERRPVSPVDVHHRHHFPRADGSGSVSSISTTAATAGTDQTERDILATSAVSPASPGGPPESTPQDRLSRILDQVRSVERTGHNSTRRPWQSHATPWTSSSVESDILLDLLPWYPNSPEQLSPTPTSVSSEAGRPISTTPALAHLHPSLNAEEDMRLLDSFWDPIFTNLPNVRLRFGSPPEDAAASTTTLERPLHYLRRPPDGDAGRSEGSVLGDRRSPGAVEAGSANLRLFQPPTRLRGNVEAGYMDYFGGVATTESPLRSTSVAGASGYRDRHAIQSDANANLGLWRPLESMELSLDLDLVTSHPSETPAENNVPHMSPSSALHEQGPASITRPYILHNSVPSSSNILRLEQDRHRARSSEEIMRRTAEFRVMERRQNMRLTTDIHETVANSTRPEEAAVSSPSYWNLSGHARSSGAASSVSLQTVMLNPTPRAGTSAHQQSSTAASTPSTSPSVSVTSERWYNDPRYRPRSIRAYAQTRFPSSNSLVAENMAEVRRRAEQAEILRAYPAYQSPSIRDGTEDSPMFADDQREDYVRQTRANHNLGRTGHRRALSVESAGLSTSTAPHSSDVSDPMDTTDNSHPTLFSHSGGAGAISGLFPPSPPRPPTLPPPDLGSSFNAPSQSRTAPRPWMSDVSDESLHMHSASNVAPSSMTSALYSTDTTTDRTYPFRSRPEATTVPLDLRHLRERSQRELARLHQHRVDDTDIHDRDRRLWNETVNESSRLIESASRVTEYMPHNGGNEALQSMRQSWNAHLRSAGDRPGEPVLPSSSPTRPAANSPRHIEPSGRYSYFDPSSFTAGPFRNTLQHMVNGRDLHPNVNSAPNASNAYPRARPTQPYSSLPMAREGGYGFPYAARPESGSTRGGSFYPVREPNEAERNIHSRRQTSHPDFHPQIMPSTGDISDGGGIENRWFRENQRAEAHHFMSSRRQEAPRLDGDSQRHINSPSSAEDQPANTPRATANMHRLRRTLLTNRLEEIEELAPSELLLVRGSRNPRRGMRGHPATLARLPQGHTGAAMGVPQWRRGRPIGDFVRDEDFDDSYESLLLLSMQIGDAKPRATPTEIVETMQKGLYRDFSGEGTDTRCPICLDDYEPTDPIQKMNNCSHWLHESCLSQWLQTANTCPVCREPVISRNSPFSSQRAPRFRAMPFHLHPTRRMTETTPVATSQESYVALPANNAPSPDLVTQNSTMPDMEHSNGSQPSQSSPTRNNSGAPWRSRRH